MSRERSAPNPRESPSVAEGAAERSPFAAALASLMGARLYRAIGLLFLLAVIFNYLEAITSMLLIAFVGVIVAVGFDAIVTRLPVKRKLGTALVALATLGGIGAALWFGFGELVRQFRGLITDLPAIQDVVEGWEAWLQEQLGMEIELVGPRMERVLEDPGGMLMAVLTQAFGVVEMVATAFLVLMGAFFLVARPNEQLLNPLMRAVPEERRPAFHRMFGRMGERIRGWMRGTLLSMLIIGALSTVVFYLLGVPYPLILGVWIGVIEVIPLIGPWIGGLTAVIVTLFHDPGLAVWVAVAVVVIQEVDGNLVRPMVMSEAAELHPFVTLLALILFGSMFGLLGALLSLPLALVIGTVVEVFWVEEKLHAGDDEIEPVVEE